MSAETWYVMEGGECGDPRDIRPDAAGVLRHKDGRAVAYGPHGPRSRSVDAAALRAAAAAKAKAPAAVREVAAGSDKPAGVDREMKADADGKTYRTRGGKGE